MTVAVAVTAATQRLARVSDSPKLEAELLLGAVCGLPRARILAFPDAPLESGQASRFEAAVERRAAGEPAAYITGSRGFHSLSLAITSNVLVPRPETELLVELCAALAGDAAVDIIDLGTGSGAIALAIKHVLPQTRVTAVDIDAAALAVAKQNAAALRLDVRLLRSDWLADVGDARFDIIVSNPPYVRSDDPHFAGPLRHEPRRALDGGADGLDAYRAILAAAGAHLGEGGHIVLEHGFDQRDALTALARDTGFAVSSVRDDLAGVPRAVVLERQQA